MSSAATPRGQPSVWSHPKVLALRQIGMHYADQLLGRFVSTRGVFLSNHAIADMIFDHFRDKPVQRSATRRSLLQQSLAARVFFQGSLEGLYLAANATE